MTTLSNTSTAPSLRRDWPSFVLSPRFWLAQSGATASSWTQTFYFFGVGILFQFVAASLIQGEASGNPVHFVLKGFLGSFFVHFTLLAIWSLAIDFAAQLRGNQGSFTLLFKKFLQLYAIHVFLLPLAMIPWGLNLSPVFFYALLDLAFLIWFAFLQIKAIEVVYNIGEHEPSNIFFLPIIVVVLWFVALFFLLILLMAL